MNQVDEDDDNVYEIKDTLDETGQNAVTESNIANVESKKLSLPDINQPRNTVQSEMLYHDLKPVNFLSQPRVKSQHKN